MTRRVVEMARAVAGRDEELRRRPIMSPIACPIDPLSNDAVSLEAALVCAEARAGRLPLADARLRVRPATLAGNLVVNLAAVLAGIVLLQLVHPGALSRPGVWDRTPGEVRLAPPPGRARSRPRRSGRVRSCGRTRQSRSPTTHAPSSGASWRRRRRGGRGGGGVVPAAAGQTTSVAAASRSSCVWLSTSTAVVSGDVAPC